MIQRPKHEEIKNVQDRIDYLSRALEQQRIISLYVEPAAFCNFACKNCNFHASRNTKKQVGIMSKSTFDRLHFQLQNLTHLPDTIHLYLHGEPLLNPKIGHMAGELRGLCKKLRLVTNGMFLSPERLSVLLGEGVRSITVSLDTISRDKFNEFKSTNQFDRVMDNIKFAISTILNIPHVELTIKGLESEDQGFNSIEFVEYFTKRYPTVKNSSNVHIEVRKEFVWPASDNLPIWHDMCELPFYQLAVHWDGKVSACCNDIEHGLNVGDIAETSLQNIIRGDRLVKLRTNMLDKDFTQLDTCLRCSFRTVVKDFGDKKDQIRGLL